MTFSNQNQIEDFRKAIIHANQYPETSASVINLLIDSGIKRFGPEVIKQIIRQYHLTP